VSRAPWRSTRIVRSKLPGPVSQENKDTGIYRGK